MSDLTPKQCSGIADAIIDALDANGVTGQVSFQWPSGVKATRFIGQPSDRDLMFEVMVRRVDGNS